MIPSSIETEVWTEVLEELLSKKIKGLRDNLNEGSFTNFLSAIRIYLETERVVEREGPTGFRVVYEARKKVYELLKERDFRIPLAFDQNLYI